MDAGRPVPVLRSFDEAAAKAFYRDFLGFEIVMEHRFAPDLPLYLGLRAGECELHLSEHHGDATPGSAVRIPVADARAYAAELGAKRFRNARPGPPTATPWGTLEFTVIDPAGNRLIFCSPGNSPGNVG